MNTKPREFTESSLMVTGVKSLSQVAKNGNCMFFFIEGFRKMVSKKSHWVDCRVTGSETKLRGRKQIVCLKIIAKYICQKFFLRFLKRSLKGLLVCSCPLREGPPTFKQRNYFGNFHLTGHN
jgi:hypothetical protein